MSFVELDNLRPFGCNQCHVVLDFVENGFVVHVDVFERGVEQVAQQSHGAAGLFVNQGRVFGGLLHFGDGVIPVFQQHFKLSVELGYPFTFGYGADDDAEVLRLDAHQQLLEAGALFARFNLLGHGNLVVEGDEHEVPAGK